MLFKNFKSFFFIVFLSFLLICGCEKAFEAVVSIPEPGKDTFSLELSNLPKKMSNNTSIDVSVSGENIIAYKYKLDNGDWQGVKSLSEKIELINVEVGDHCLLILGKKNDETWQSEEEEIIEYCFSIFDKNEIGSEGIGFGQSVSISSDGKKFIVGAPGAGNKGEAHSYEFANGSWEETKMVPFGSLSNDAKFGQSVSISPDGKNAIIGAPKSDSVNTKAGAVFLFWVNEFDNKWRNKSISKSYPMGWALEGASVAISSDGENYIVGTPLQGMAHQKINTGIFGLTDPPFGGYIGASVDISFDGKTAIVGAPEGMTGESNKDTTGVSFVVNCLTLEKTRVVASNISKGDLFGSSVSMSSGGGIVVVGAPGAEEKGASYIFKKESDIWVEKKLTSTTSASGDLFGTSVAISNDGTTLAIGAPGHGGTGAVYTYKYTAGAWTETKHTPSDGASGALYGTSVSMTADGNMVLIGAPGKKKIYLIYP